MKLITHLERTRDRLAPTLKRLWPVTPGHEMADDPRHAYPPPDDPSNLTQIGPRT